VVHTLYWPSHGLLDAVDSKKFQRFGYRQAQPAVESDMSLVRPGQLPGPSALKPCSGFRDFVICLLEERENKVSNSAHYGAVIQLAAKHAGKVSNLLRKIATAADVSHGNVSNPVARQALLGHVAWSSDDLA
jgi:hypothetical protein